MSVCKLLIESNKDNYCHANMLEGHLKSHGARNRIDEYIRPPSEGPMDKYIKSEPNDSTNDDETDEGIGSNQKV